MNDKNLYRHIDIAAHLSNQEPSLWMFCVEVYALNDVERWCLDIQNRYGGNVLIVLWLMWLHFRRLRLPEPNRELIIEWVNQQAKTLLSPLRDVRESIKTCEALGQTHTDDIKKKILSAELSIERQLIDYIQKESEIGLTKSLNKQAYNTLNGSVDNLLLERYLESLSVENLPH